MTKQPETPTLDRTRRPGAITFLAVLAGLISFFHLVKFGQVLLNWRVLLSLNPNAPLIYLAGDGLVWFAACGVLAWGLWTGRPWTRSTGQIISVLYFLGFWIDKLWIANPDKLLRRWPVYLLNSLVGLGLILWILTRPANREYFEKNPVKIT